MIKLLSISSKQEIHEPHLTVGIGVSQHPEGGTEGNYIQHRAAGSKLVHPIKNSIYWEMRQSGFYIPSPKHLCESVHQN